MTRQSSSTPPGSNSPGGGRSAAQLATPLPTGLIGRYQILDKIGEGGMGSLFLARDPAIDRLVAIKLLRHGLDTEPLRERFAREARAAGRLRHPHIVTIFDVGEHEGVPFIAMEFLAGETLAELIRDGARLSLSRRLKLLEELCDGLAYAHRSGLVHRDVKPANLMVDADGVLKILDFGIVRVSDSGMTQAGVLVGTVNYMSPEQVVGGAVDHRSDIFSVGLVAYELISGRQAFAGTMKDGLLNKILNVAPDPLSVASPGIDANVAAIVDQALRKDPADRYQDLVRMRNDLSRARVRIERDEEQSAAAAAADAGETAVIGEHATLADEPPRALPAIVVHDAERALAVGNFRAALTLAGRSAAINPQDRAASSIAARAEAALLDRGRLLQSGAAVSSPVLPASSVPPAPVSSSSSAVQAGGERAIWTAVIIAVLALGVAIAGFWLRNPAEGPTRVGTDQPASKEPLPGSREPPPTPSTRSASNQPAPQPPAAITPPDPASGNPTVEPSPSAPLAGSPPAQPSVPAAVPEGVSRGGGPTGVSRGGGPTTVSRGDGPTIGPRGGPSRGRRGEPERLPPPTARSAAPPPSPAAPPPATPPVAERPATPLRAGFDVTAPDRKRYVAPVYPPEAQAAGVEGTVQLELTIGPDGHVSEARVVRSIPGLDEAAVTAAKQWEFAPTRRDGTPVSVVYSVPVPFKSSTPARPPAATPPAASKPPEPAAPPPSAPAKPAESSRAAPPSAADAREEIDEVLRRYKAAWDGLNLEGLRRVQALSRDEEARIRQTMTSANSYRLDYAVQSVRVDPSGNTAVARVAMTYRYNPKIGRASAQQATQDVHLEKRGDTWMITSIR